MIEIGQKYRHFKGHKIEILNFAIHSETLEKMIVYKHSDDDKIWVRPESMFFLDNDVSDRLDNITGQKYRFELLKEE